MRTVAALFIAGASILAGQTRVRPEQIRNVQQVRIYFGDGSGQTTRVLAAQISDGRLIASLQTLKDGMFPVDISPVCIVEFIGVTMPERDMQVDRTIGCYTMMSIPILRLDPNWSAWLAAHGQ